jgi:hypothetical protein
MHSIVQMVSLATASNVYGDAVARAISTTSLIVSAVPLDFT